MFRLKRSLDAVVQEADQSKIEGLQQAIDTLKHGLSDLTEVGSPRNMANQPPFSTSREKSALPHRLDITTKKALPPCTGRESRFYGVRSRL